jgi:hypothetical protein
VVLWHAGSLREPTEDDLLPEYQGPARVTLLVIDPYLVHAYWDLDQATLPEASHGVLRVHDTTEEVSSYFDVPVSLGARNWYIHFWTPERSYYAELGLSEQAGDFTSLARSNTIQTPRAWPAVGTVTSGQRSEPLPLPLVAAQQDSGAQNLSVLEPDSGVQTDIVFEPDSGVHRDSGVQRDTVLPSRDRQGAVFPASGIPEPMDAPRILRTRLEQIYASLEWMFRADRAAELPAPADVPGPPPASGPAAPRDLTQHAEEHFSTGVSSKIPKPV